MTKTTDLLCKAIRDGLCVELTYNGYARVVEAHAVGRNANTKHTLLRCYQISGGSQSNQPIGWKLMVISQISDCKLSETHSKAPRPEYVANDSAMTGGVICCV